MLYSSISQIGQITSFSPLLKFLFGQSHPDHYSNSPLNSPSAQMASVASSPSLNCTRATNPFTFRSSPSPYISSVVNIMGDNKSDLSFLTDLVPLPSIEFDIETEVTADSKIAVRTPNGASDRFRSLSASESVRHPRSPHGASDWFLRLSAG